MNKRKILVVDDEQNTRTTLEHALEPLSYDIVLAASGEEALQWIADPGIALVLLDLRMPGLSGMEVLRRFEQERPDVRVVIMTAHGTVTAAVESMKRGALDVLQKPFSLEQIRALVRQEMDPAIREAATRAGYDQQLRDARAKIRDGALDAALGQLRAAFARDPDRPEAFNLMGVIAEIRRNRPEAQRQYRLALDLEPTYAPARRNLEKSVGDPVLRGPMLLGDEAEHG